MAIKTFTTGEVLTAADTNTYLANSGLTYITSASLTGVTNTFSNCFSTTYDSYRIVISNLNNATGSTRQMSLRMGTDASAQYGAGEQYIYGAGNSGVTGSTAQTESKLGNISIANAQGLFIDMANPFLTSATTWAFQMLTYQSDVAAWVYRTGYGVKDSITSYTGFQIIGTTDNLSGLVTIYGYRKA
jgi:hypothetical protein